MVIASAKIHLTKPGLKLCADSNPVREVSEICYGGPD